MSVKKERKERIHVRSLSRMPPIRLHPWFVCLFLFASLRVHSRFIFASLREIFLRLFCACIDADWTEPLTVAISLEKW
jgi:hypothetical protein